MRNEAEKRIGARQGRWLLAGCLAVGVAALGWFASSSSDRSFIYSREVGPELAEFASTPEGTRRLRVNGVLVTGSLKSEGRCRGTFRLRPRWAGATTEGRSTELLVRYEQCSGEGGICDLPGMDTELMVEGRLVREGTAVVFDADKAMAKCPTKYDRQAARTACEQAPEHLRRLCGWCQYVLN